MSIAVYTFYYWTVSGEVRERPFQIIWHLSVRLSNLTQSRRGRAHHQDEHLSGKRYDNRSTRLMTSSKVARRYKYKCGTRINFGPAKREEENCA